MTEIVGMELAVDQYSRYYCSSKCDIPGYLKQILAHAVSSTKSKLTKNHYDNCTERELVTISVGCLPKHFVASTHVTLFSSFSVAFYYHKMNVAWNLHPSGLDVTVGRQFKKVPTDHVI